jgi:hypothetical protein
VTMTDDKFCRNLFNETERSASTFSAESTGRKSAKGHCLRTETVALNFVTSVIAGHSQVTFDEELPLLKLKVSTVTSSIRERADARRPGACHISNSREPRENSEAAGPYISETSPFKVLGMLPARWRTVALRAASTKPLPMNKFVVTGVPTIDANEFVGVATRRGHRLRCHH